MWDFKDAKAVNDYIDSEGSGHTKRIEPTDGSILKDCRFVIKANGVTEHREDGSYLTRWLVH